MRWKFVVATLAAACLMHVQIAAAQGESGAKDRPKEASESDGAKRPSPPPVPVAKPSAGEPAKADAKAGDNKPGEGSHPSPTAQLGGALPLGSGERPFNAPDCRYTGSRVIHTLLREEVDAASQFTRFYSLFGCPGQHLGIVLSCVVDWQGDPARSREERVDACWADPSKPRIQTAEPKDNGKPGGDEKPPPVKN